MSARNNYKKQMNENYVVDLEEKLRIARGALKWYADPIAYSMPVRDMEHHVFPDRGQMARKALARIEEKP